MNDLTLMLHPKLLLLQELVGRLLVLQLPLTRKQLLLNDLNHHRARLIVSFDLGVAFASRVDHSGAGRCTKVALVF